MPLKKDYSSEVVIVCGLTAGTGTKYCTTVCAKWMQRIFDPVVRVVNCKLDHCYEIRTEKMMLRPADPVAEYAVPKHPLRRARREAPLSAIIR
jgi:hypothetical protein